MHTQPPETTALPETIGELEAMAEDLTRQMDACDTRCAELMAAEDPAKGIVHAAEIHANRQQKNQLAVTRQFVQVHLNRLRLDAESA